MILLRAAGPSRQEEAALLRELEMEGRVRLKAALMTTVFTTALVLGLMLLLGLKPGPLSYVGVPIVSFFTSLFVQWRMSRKGKE
jgi:hypothetical protein